MAEGPVLVVGGSRGIGRSVVEGLVAEGRPAAFTYRVHEEDAQKLADLSGGLARAFRFDVDDREAAAPLVAAVEAAVGPLAGLVYCAGLRRDALCALLSDADWDAVLDANLGGLFRMCRAVLPGMLRRREGAIVTVSSLSAYHGVAGQAAYCAAKSGVLGLTRALARECGKRGVRVNAVVPGFVPTDFVADVPPEVVALLRAPECLPGGVTTDGVAGAVVYLLSARAGSITGQALTVDAGATA
jgi:3-oxoacyl-[acyl-carrier protein] reductase